MSTVWIAVDQYPESNTVLVAATEEVLLREIVATIGRSEYEAFAASLRGDESTTVTYDDDPREVIKIWAGDIDSTDDGYFIGDSWLVLETEVTK